MIRLFFVFALTVKASSLFGKSNCSRIFGLLTRLKGNDLNLFSKNTIPAQSSLGWLGTDYFTDRIDRWFKEVGDLVDQSTELSASDFVVLRFHTQRLHTACERRPKNGNIPAEFKPLDAFVHGCSRLWKIYCVMGAAKAVVKAAQAKLDEVDPETIDGDRVFISAGWSWSEYRIEFLRSEKLPESGPHHFKENQIAQRLLAWVGLGDWRSHFKCRGEDQTKHPHYQLPFLGITDECTMKSETKVESFGKLKTLYENTFTRLVSLDEVFSALYWSSWSILPNLSEGGRILKKHAISKINFFRALHTESVCLINDLLDEAIKFIHTNHLSPQAELGFLGGFAYHPVLVKMGLASDSKTSYSKQIIQWLSPLITKIQSRQSRPNYLDARYLMWFKQVVHSLPDADAHQINFLASKSERLTYMCHSRPVNPAWWGYIPIDEYVFTCRDDLRIICILTIAKAIASEASVFWQSPDPATIDGDKVFVLNSILRYEKIFLFLNPVQLRFTSSKRKPAVPYSDNDFVKRIIAWIGHFDWECQGTPSTLLMDTFSAMQMSCLPVPTDSESAVNLCLLELKKLLTTSSTLSNLKEHLKKCLSDI